MPNLFRHSTGQVTDIAAHLAYEMPKQVRHDGSIIKKTPNRGLFYLQLNLLLHYLQHLKILTELKFQTFIAVDLKIGYRFAVGFYF